MDLRGSSIKGFVFVKGRNLFKDVSSEMCVKIVTFYWNLSEIKYKSFGESLKPKDSQLMII